MSTQLMFAVTPAPDPAMLDRQVEAALAMFFASYGQQPQRPGDGR